MCEFSETLIAWLDGELPADEASLVERHLHSCSECPERIGAYKEVGAALAEYCDSVMAPARTRPHWMVLASTGAVAAGVVLIALVLRTPGSPIPAPSVPGINPPAIAFEHPAAALREMHRRRARKDSDPSLHPAATAVLPQAQDAIGRLPEIEIAIPAEAIFPPGAVPEGFQFVATVSIGADGSAQNLRLRPY